MFCHYLPVLELNRKAESSDVCFSRKKKIWLRVSILPLKGMPSANLLDSTKTWFRHLEKQDNMNTSFKVFVKVN